MLKKTSANVTEGGETTRTRKHAADPRRDALVMYRQRCLSLERQVARLLSSDPLRAAEAEVSRLEARCFDLTARWSEAESECYELRKMLLGKAG